MHGAQRMRGFSLLEIAIALTIIGFVTYGAMDMLQHLTVARQERLTEKRMETVRDALTRYFARNCELPCASPPLAGGSDAGTEECGDSNASAIPWENVGVPKATTFDGWNRRFRYRPASDLTSSACPFSDPISWLGGKGLTIQTREGKEFRDPAEGTGAAFVLVSHGPNGRGAIGRNADVPQDPEPGSHEDENADGDDVFVRGRFGQNFDDPVMSVTVHALLNRAGFTDD